MSDNPVISWMKNPLGIGTLLLVMFGGAVVFALNAVHGMPIVERKEVKVAFEDLSGINTGDDVRIAGKRVGYVDDLRLEDGKAVLINQDDPAVTLATKLGRTIIPVVENFDELGLILKHAESYGVRPRMGVRCSNPPDWPADCRSPRPFFWTCSWRVTSPELSFRYRGAAREEPCESPLLSAASRRRHS